MDKKYKYIFHGNLQDASSISGESIIFLHDYIMFYLIIIIVVIMVLMFSIYRNYSFEFLKNNNKSFKLNIFNLKLLLLFFKNSKKK